MKLKLNQYRNQICVIIAVGFSILLTGCIVRKQALDQKIQATQEHLASEVLRFHVLANSDSDDDQALKLKVKSGIIEYMQEQLPESNSIRETKEWAQANQQEITETAENIIQEEGYDYLVSVAVTNCYFPDKKYGDVIFPAGQYEALRVEIGEAKGRNWWCVLYPNLCFIDATTAVVSEEGKEDLQEVLEEEEYEMVTATSEFKIKWYFFGDEE